VNVTQIPVKEIMIDPARRKLLMNSSSWIYSSISLIGLRTPISVRRRSDTGYDLVTGRQRLAAVTQLNHKTIDAFVYDVSTPDVEIEMWEVVENLHRSDLDRIERGVLTGRYFELEKVLKGEGGSLPAQAAQPTRLERAEVTAKVADSPGQVDHGKRNGRGGGNQHLRGGKSEFARKFDRPRKEVERDLKIAELKDEAKDTARELGLANNQRVLLKAAKEKEPEAQVAVLQEHAAKKAAPVTSPAAPQPAPEPVPPPQPAPETVMLPQVTLIDHVWDSLTDEERDAFLDDVALPWRASRKATV